MTRPCSRTSPSLAAAGGIPSPAWRVGPSLLAFLRVGGAERHAAVQRLGVAAVAMPQPGLRYVEFQTVAAWSVSRCTHGLLLGLAPDKNRRHPPKAAACPGPCATRAPVPPPPRRSPMARRRGWRGHPPSTHADVDTAHGSWLNNVSSAANASWLSSPADLDQRAIPHRALFRGFGVLSLLE